jgi:hypothetical protein
MQNAASRFMASFKKPSMKNRRSSEQMDDALSLRLYRDAAWLATVAVATGIRFQLSPPQ